MKTDLMWEQGGLRQSDSPMDYALPNDGFFMVSDRRGETYLTRDGAFDMTVNTDNNNTWELVNGSGEYVLDYEGNHIPIPFLTKTITGDELGADREVTTNEVDYEALTKAIGVYTVPNNFGLDNAENNRFTVTPRSGEPVADQTLDKMREFLENSTVDLAGEMVHIIESQRSYQLASKIVQTSDEFIRIANNLR
jgi:flagellar basal-body rod protein FlgG